MPLTVIDLLACRFAPGQTGEQRHNAYKHSPLARASINSRKSSWKQPRVSSPTSDKWLARRIGSVKRSIRS